MNKRNHLKFSNPATELLAVTLISLSLLGPAYAESSPVGTPDTSGSADGPVRKGGATDLSILLPFLVTSADQKRLAAELLSSIERDDLKGAENSLNGAIEAGTLAITLIDHLRDPALLPILQGLSLQRAQSPSASSDTCRAPASPVVANLVQLQEALDHEHSYSGMISQTLTDLMGQYNTLTARLETEASSTGLKVSELERALKQEQEQREAVMRELTSLQADYRTLQTAGEQSVTTKSPSIAHLEAMLQQERERSDNVERQLASSREEIRILQAFKDKEAASGARIAELEKALSQAQAKSDDFAQQLATAAEALHAFQDTRQQNPAPLPLEPVPMGGQAFASLVQEVSPVQAPSALSSASASIASDEHEVEAENATSALSGKKNSPVEIAQLPPEVRPLTTRSTSAGISAPQETLAAPEAKAGSSARELKPDDRLTARADELFRKGDVSGARLLLEHSLKSGNARAAFLLAETYDPHVLAKLGVMGIRGDAAKARELYAQAQALGMTQASARIEALK